jgi:enoyl-CoA hydratase/carnithine racemase
VAGFLGKESLAGLGERALPECLDRLKFSKKLGFKAPLSLAAVERLTAVAAAGDHGAGLAAETAGLEAIFSSRDALEGLSSVLERRRPAFNGS